jgi:hypothetical protein
VGYYLRCGVCIVAEQPMIPNCYREPETKDERKKIIWLAFTWCLLVFYCLVIYFLVIAPASAMTITMSNPGGMAERDIVVFYGNNGTQQGFYNSTSVIDLDANSSYLFMMKPIQTNPFDDPADWLFNSVIPAVQTYALALLFIAFLIMYVRR